MRPLSGVQDCTGFNWSVVREIEKRMAGARETNFMQRSLQVMSAQGPPGNDEGSVDARAATCVLESRVRSVH